MSKLTRPLLSEVRKEAEHDWLHNMGDVRLLRQRVLTAKLIRLEDPAVDALLAEHYRLPAAPTKSASELPAGVLAIEISR